MGKTLQTILVLIAAAIAGVVGFRAYERQKSAEDDAVRQCVSRMTAAGTATASTAQICRDTIRREKQLSN